MSITIQDVTWGIDQRRILHGISAEIDTGQVVGLIGPNGCGKSSLIRCAAGLRAPDSGSIHLDGRDIAAMRPRERARRLALVEQVTEVVDDLRVGDVVELGRSPHRDRWRAMSRNDKTVVAAAMERAGVAHLADRHWRQISGGERQRTQIARAFAQQTPVLVLDEPTNHLNLRHQLALMESVRASGATVLISLHDLGLAGRYCDRLLLMHEGQLIADGTPHEVLTMDLISQVFAVHAEVKPQQGTWMVSTSPM